MQDRMTGLGHNNPPAAVIQPWTSAPGLAGRPARIRRRDRSVETSGRAGADAWVLTFERETPPEIDPPIGRTGGADPRATEVALTFPTRVRAEAYAARQGLAYRVEARDDDERPPGSLRVWRSNRPAPPAPPARRPGSARPLAPALPDLERALINPAAVFDTPAAVLDQTRLLPSCKREILRRWVWDEYLKEVAAAEGMAEGEPSRLDAVKAALLALDGTRPPHPAAPAATPPISRAVESRRVA